MTLTALALSLDEEIILTDRVDLDSSRQSKIRKLEAYLKVAEDNYAKLLQIQLLEGLSEKQVNEIRSELTSSFNYLDKLKGELKKLNEDPEDAEIKAAITKFPIDEETREIMYAFADKVLEDKDKRIEELERNYLKPVPFVVPNIDRDEETLRQLKLLEGTKEVYSDDLALVSPKESIEPIEPLVPEEKLKEFGGKLKLLEEFKKKISNPPLFDCFHWMSPPLNSKEIKVDLIIKDIGNNSDSELRYFASNLIRYDNLNRKVAIVSKEKPGISWIISSIRNNSETMVKNLEIEINIELTDHLRGPVEWIKVKL